MFYHCVLDTSFSIGTITVNVSRGNPTSLPPSTVLLKGTVNLLFVFSPQHGEPKTMHLDFSWYMCVCHQTWLFTVLPPKIVSQLLCLAIIIFEKCTSRSRQL